MKGALCLSHALQPDVSGWGMNWSHNVFRLTWVCWILHGFPWWSMFWCDSLPRASSLRKTQGLRFPRAVLCQRWSSRGALGFPGSVMTSFLHPDALRPQIWLMFLMRFPRGVWEHPTPQQKVWRQYLCECHHLMCELPSFWFPMFSKQKAGVSSLSLGARRLSAEARGPFVFRSKETLSASSSQNCTLLFFHPFQIWKKKTGAALVTFPKDVLLV